MFLRSQHFQQADRHAERLLRQRVADITPWGWGWRRLRLDTSLLALGKIALAEADGVLPDGTPIQIPEDVGPLQPLQPAPGLANAIIYLCVPVQQAGGVDFAVADDMSAQTRYVCATAALRDATSRTAATADIQIATPRLSLQAGDADMHGFVRLAVARLRDIGPDGAVHLDATFIPPLLCVAASRALAGLLDEVRGLLRRRAETLRAGQAEGAYASAASDLLLAQTLNAAARLLDHLAALPALHPERVYAEPVRLAGALEVFAPPDQTPPPFPAYRHDDLAAFFAPVLAALRRTPGANPADSAVQIALIDQKYGMRTGTLGEPALWSTARFILAVQAAQPQAATAQMFPALVTIGPASQLSQLVNAQLPGARVRLLDGPPPRAPLRPGAVFFEIDTSSPIWAGVADCGAIGLHLSGHFPELCMELWALRQPGQTDARRISPPLPETPA